MATPTTITFVQARANLPQPKISTAAYKGDACLDLFASERVVLPARKTLAVATNLRIFKHTLPDDAYIQILNKSSMSLRGIFCSGGVIDNGYSGELAAIMHNSTEDDYTIEANTAVAQFCALKRIYPLQVQLVDMDDPTLVVATNVSPIKIRGDRGFGSSEHNVM